jgi:hypothetical protein
VSTFIANGHSLVVDLYEGTTTSNGAFVTGATCTIAAFNTSCTLPANEALTPGDFLTLHLADTGAGGDNENVTSGGATITFNVTGGSATQVSGPHINVGQVTGVGTTGTAVFFNGTVGASAFTSATSYYCTATDETNATAVKIVQTSGTQITISVSTGTADTISYMCVGT